jgi:hypothetical protein
MKNFIKNKIVIALLTLLPLFSIGQIGPATETLITGTYAKGSSIALPVAVSGCFKPDNKFELYLSPSDFTSDPGIKIGQYTATYIHFINGQIPSDGSFSPQAGQVYQLKVRSTNPVAEWVSPTRFSIAANSGPSALVAVPPQNVLLRDTIFGLCQANFNNAITFSISKSTSNTDANTLIGYLKDESAGTISTNKDISSSSFTNTYTGPKRWSFIVTATGANGSISTRGYIIANLKTATGISIGSLTGCAPENLAIRIPTTNGGIENNDPACQYKIDWGDGNVEIKSHCEVMTANGNFVHQYSNSSCTATDKKFTITVTTLQSIVTGANTNPLYCSSTTSPVTSSAIIGLPERADFTLPSFACLNNNVQFINTSDPGTVPIVSGANVVTSCDNNPSYQSIWYVDQTPINSNSTISQVYTGLKNDVGHNFSNSFNSIGLHTISLIVSNSWCNTTQQKDKTICIEKAPIARFGYNVTSGTGFTTGNGDTTFCFNNAAFTIPNRSNVMADSVPCSNTTYAWVLRNSSNEIISSQTSLNFSFPAAVAQGIYTLTLTTTNSCGSNSKSHTLTVLTAPAFAPAPTDKTVCDGQSVVFSGAATGSNLNYKWQLSTDGGSTFTDLTNGGIYSGVTTNTLTINPASVSMNGYRYKLVIVGSCTPDIEKIVLLTVNPRPTSVISGSTTVCENSPATISIALTGTAPWNITYSDGTNSTSVTTSSSTYTFNVSLATTKTYTVSSLLDANCTAAAGDRTGSAVITVNPLPTISGTLNACVGSTTQLSGSATADATTPWSSASTGVATISNTGLVTGVSAGTSVITYTNSNGCIRTATVTINPLPTVSIPTGLQNLCLNTTPPSITSLTPTTSPSINSYQWYSNTTASTSGGTAVATSSTFTPTNTNAGELYYYLTVTNNNGCVATSNVSGSIKVFGKPTITTLPSSTSYCINATATTLTPTILNGGYGTLTYQWYSNTTSSTSGATLIPNETNATFTPPTTAVGVKFYYVVVTNGGPTSSSNCNTETSSITEVKVYATPTITTDPVSATYCAGATPVALSIPGATAGGYGTASYQWYSNTTASTTGGTLVASTATYTPNISSTGTTYYFANVSNGATGGASGCNNRNSDFAIITVHPLPVVTSATFATESLCISSTATSMTASATTTTGTITGYQWYKNTSNSYIGATPIANQTNATFTPPTTTTGTTYYYCEITNSWGCKTNTAISGAINVYAAPIINTQPTGATYCQNTTATALSVTATAGGLGTPTYQWYSNTTNTNAGGTPITGATSTTYTPSTSTVGTTYYYVNINNGGGASGCSILASNAVAIVVNDLPVINAISLGTQSICLNATPANLSVTASTATGTISATGYQWFSNNTSSTSGATILSGANTNTYTPPTNVAGTKYYFAEITNSFNCTTTSIVSGAINVNALPTISSQPSQNIQTKCLNEAFTALSVSASTGSGSISKYEWYSNTTNSTTGGTIVATNNSNALTNSYTPSSSSAGVLYYYVIVYNTNGCQITSAISAPFTVNDLPSISLQPSSSNQTACLNTPTTNLTVSASPGSGDISTYTWYKTTSLTPVSWTVAATNTTSSTTNTFTPASNTVGTLYYYVRVTNSNGCIKASDASGSVTINPVAIISNQLDTYCSGFQFSKTLTTGGSIIVPANTTYSWNAPNITGGLTGGAPGTAQTTLNGTLVNPTNTSQTATYSVIPRTGSCDGASFTYTVTINPKAIITVADLNACSGSPFEFEPIHGTNGNIIPANTTYAWSLPLVTGGITGGATASSQNKFNGNLTNPNNTQKTATYTVTPTSPVGPCIGSDFTIVVNVNARPVIANKTQTICSGTAFSITPANAGSEIVPANTTYSWTVQDNASVTGESNGNTTGTTISQTLTNNSNLVQTVIYTVIPVSGDVGNCTGPTFTITVTVNPKPLISAKTVPACSNELFTATITNGSNNDIVPNGITYTWSAPIVTGNMTGGAAGNAASSVSGNLTNPTSVEQTATYTVRPIVPGTTSCTGPDFTVVATIKPKATIESKATTACSNDAFTFTLQDGTGNDVIPSGTTYTWSNAPTVTGGLTGGTAGSVQNTVGGTLANPSNTSQTATYFVTANSNGCSSTPFSATATIYARPFINTQNVFSCSGSAFSVPLSNGGGNILPSSTTYTWTVVQNNNVTGATNVNVATSAITQTLTNITNTDQVVVYTVTPISGIDGNCVGQPFTVNVTVKPKPSVTSQSETICSGINFTNLPTNGNGNIIPAGTTFTWTTPSSNPVGAVSGGSAQISAQTQVLQLLTNNTNAPATLTYTVTPSANGCAGTPYQLIVNVNPKPAITAMSATICSSETFTTVPVNGTNGIVPANTSYTWEVADNPNVTGESRVTTGSINISQTLVNTSNTPQTVTYTVLPTSGEAGACTGNTFSVSVLVNPQPTISVAQVQTVCSGTPFNIAPVNNTDGIVPSNTKYTWANPIDNPVGSITGQSAQLVAANSVSQLLNNITNAPATISYTVTPIAGTCTGPNFTAVITVNPKPNINAQARTICSEETFTVLPVNSADGIVPNNTTYTWSNPTSNPVGAITGWSAQTTASNNISQQLTNTTNAAATLTYSVIPKSGAAGNCTGSPFNVVVSVNAKPVIGNQTRDICSGAAFNVALTNGGSTIIPTGTTYTWFVSTNNTNITGQSDVTVGQSSIGQTLTNNTNVAQQITYTVTPKSGATGQCIGATFLVTVTVNPKPVITTQTQTICSNATFMITPVNGGNLIVPASTTYTWTSPTSSPLGAISGGAAQLSSVSNISQLLTNNSNSQALLTYVVTPTSGTAGSCVGAPFNVEITVSPKPILTSSLTPPAICNATNFSYNPITPTDGASYVWTRNTIVGISNTSGTGNGQINETLINTTPNRITVAYSFALTAYGCPNTETVNVIVNPTPQLTSLLSNPAQCSGTPFYYNPTSATVGTTYTWTRANIGGISNPAANGSGAISETLINTSPNPIVVNYVFTLTANGCTNQQSISVTIDPLPIASFNIGGVRADCGPITRTFINNSSVNSSPLTNGTFTWGIDILRNGGSVPVYSLINTNYTTQVNYTFTNTGIQDSLYPIFLTAKSPNGCLNTYRDTITVHPDARIDLTIGTTAACAPFNAINSLNVVNKTDPSPNPTINLFSSYKWTIRDRNGNILSNTISPNPPNYVITNPDDTLKIALKVNSLYGCRPDSVNRIVYTYQNPIVNFSVAPQNSCTMLSTQAVNTSYIGPNRTTSTLRYAWYANGSLLSNAGVPGTFNLINNSNTRDTIYTIKLVVSETINNCKDSSSVGNLVVYPKPKAIFTIDKADEVCTTISGVNSSINNSSLFKNGTVPQYKWSVTYNNLYDTARAIVIDSTTAPYIAARPNFKFKDAKGTVDTSYNINMMIYTVNGCIDTLTKSIKIRRRPNVNFTIPVEGCGIYIVNPTDNTINFPNDSLNRQWTVLPTGGVSLFSANSNIPNVIFPVNNTANSIAYKVKQSVTVKGFDDCIDSLNRFITIHPKPTASFTVGKIDSCGPWTKTFRNTSDPKNGLGLNAITSRWEVRRDNIVKLNTSAQNLTYTFTNSGVVDSVYTVRLFVSNPQGCLDTTALQQITVHPNARAFFNTDTLGCAPFKIRDHIKVQDFPGANDIWRYEWRIYDRFGFLQGNYDSSVLAPDYIIQNESDTVTLQLIAYSKWGCTQDIFSRQVITRPNSVKANVTADSTICSNLPLAFTNTSYYGINNQTSGLIYDWYVNDSKVTSLNSPTFIFKNNSNVSDSILYVKLVTTYTGTGCNDSVTKKITIYPAPAPNFTVTTKEICGNPVGFKNFVTESIIAKNNIYNATWAVTNVTLNKPSGIQVLPTSTNKRFQLQFGDNPGNIDTIYSIKLSATSIDGCKADTSTNISLYRRPNVKFTISNSLVCGEITLQLTDQTSNVPTSKAWSYITPTGNPLLFFPSATAISPKVLVPPNITGNLVTYYIKQVATTVNGCIDSAIVQLDAKALPTAAFSMSDSTSCNDSITIKFKDESIPRTPETIIRWSWDFGDGITSNSQNPTHFYSKPGTYNISLVITNNEGCSSLPTRKKLVVYGSPRASFVMPKQICLTDSIPFVNTSTLGYGNTQFVSYTWDFGDGIPLNYSINPTHRFKYAGTFGVSLTVRADNSCKTSTFVDSVTVIGYPDAKFGIVNYCVESPIFFKDSSVAGYADKLGSWRWDFGDKSFSSVTNPVHIYKSVGTFPVQLIVGGNLCPNLQDTITIPIKIIDRRRDSVYAIKYLQYNVAQSLCAVPGGDKYTWSPSTDINPIDSRCVNINVQHPKTTYKITIIDSAGCTITDRQEIWGFPGTDIFLPRAFIPASNNRDNAIFKPIYVGVTAIKYFKIYDRFGHEVFTTSDMSKYWDGTSNGVNQPMETYTWIIQGFDYNNKPVIRQGNVTLIRYQ